MLALNGRYLMLFVVCWIIGLLMVNGYTTRSNTREPCTHDIHHTVRQYDSKLKRFGKNSLYSTLLSASSRCGSSAATTTSIQLQHQKHRICSNSPCDLKNASEIMKLATPKIQVNATQNVTSSKAWLRWKGLWDSFKNVTFQIFDNFRYKSIKEKELMDYGKEETKPILQKPIGHKTIFTDTINATNITKQYWLILVEPPSRDKEHIFESITRRYPILTTNQVAKIYKDAKYNGKGIIRVYNSREEGNQCVKWFSRLHPPIHVELLQVAKNNNVTLVTPSFKPYRDHLSDVYRG